MRSKHVFVLPATKYKPVNCVYCGIARKKLFHICVYKMDITGDIVMETSELMNSDIKDSDLMEMVAAIEVSDECVGVGGLNPGSESCSSVSPSMSAALKLFKINKRLIH